ncbi:MAG: histidine kinase [Deltaproteobacteria bacterium]|nr:histidine kinase [Deltaproteobacteria bacterium]
MLELAMHILDIAENSVRAGAKLITIRILEDLEKDLYVMEIADDGRGMNAGERQRALDPFYTTKKVRKVGLGLPLLQNAARNTGGAFRLDSAVGRGTTVTANFRRGHIDRQPLGNIASSLLGLILGNPGVDFLYHHRVDGRSYTLDTRELKKELEDVPLSHPEVTKFIRENINEGLKEIGVQDMVSE